MNFDDSKNNKIEYFRKPFEFLISPFRRGSLSARKFPKKICLLSFVHSQFRARISPPFVLAQISRAPHLNGNARIESSFRERKRKKKKEKKKTSFEKSCVRFKTNLNEGKQMRCSSRDRRRRDLAPLPLDRSTFHCERCIT